MGFPPHLCNGHALREDSYTSRMENSFRTEKDELLVLLGLHSHDRRQCHRLHCSYCDDFNLVYPDTEGLVALDRRSLSSTEIH